MPKKEQKTLTQKIMAVKIALTNMQYDDLRAGFPKYGYNDETMAKGQAIYDEVLALVQAKETADINMNHAQRDLTEAQKSAKTFYNQQVSIARIVFTRDPARIKELGINGRRSGTFAGWTNQAKSFYTLAQKPEILVNLERLGTSSATLTQGLQLITQLSSLYAKKLDQKGLAQVALEKRNKKCKELFDWYWDFKRVARIVLGNDSQHLERFGITVYSPGYKPKKNDTPTTPEDFPGTE